MTTKSAVLIAALVLAGCTDNPGAQMALEADGYTNISMTGYAWFSCDKNDTFRSGFAATSKAGKRVTGAVCSGWFKGYTIRITGFLP